MNSKNQPLGKSYFYDIMYTMSVLEFAQTLFFLTASIAIIVIGSALTVIVYNLVHTTRELRKIAHNLGAASADIHAHIENMFEKLSNLPFIATLMKLITRKKKKKVSEE